MEPQKNQQQVNLKSSEVKPLNTKGRTPEEIFVDSILMFQYGVSAIKQPDGGYQIYFVR